MTKSCGWADRVEASVEEKSSLKKEQALRIDIRRIAGISNQFQEQHGYSPRS
jgi:hypothetical protein